MTNTVTEFQNYLGMLNACVDARIWAGDRTAQQAWDECDRADWLLWWLAKSDLDRKQLVRIACACARTALPFVAAGEMRPLKAIETAEAWCDGRATIQEVRAAAAAAASASATVAAYAAAYAAASATVAATVAAYAADAAAYASAAAAASAAATVAAYAAATVAAYARQKAHQAMCALIRDMATCPKGEK